MSNTGVREASLPYLTIPLMCGGCKGAFIGLIYAMLLSRRDTWDPCDRDYHSSAVPSNAKHEGDIPQACWQLLPGAHSGRGAAPSLMSCRHAPP